MSDKPFRPHVRQMQTAWVILGLAITTIVMIALYTRGTNEQPAQSVTTYNPTSPGQPVTREWAIQELPLSGILARAEAEVSGLSWYGDNLILLPQYPNRTSTQADAALFAIPKTELIRSIQGQGDSPLSPREIPFYTEGIESNIPGFEGFEAIGFQDDQIFLTIEASKGGQMMGYVVAGKIAPDLSEVRLNPASLVMNKPQTNLENKSDEALLVWQGQIITIYEANGAAVNPAPHVTLFNPDLEQVGTLSFPHVEYRITDAAAPESTSRFWATNYFFPDEDYLKPIEDPLAGRYGEGPTHAESEIVERLVQFQITPSGISLSGAPPIQLQLMADGSARNWEGLAQLDEMGFLIATDKYPTTILAFVAAPP